MTDETTARDRADARKALDVLSVAAPLTVEVREAVETLSRALAGAPTADVAALLAIAETARRMYAATDAGDRQDAANASRTLRDLLAAPAVEPEGVDVADDLRTEWGVRLPGLPDEVNDWEDDKLGSQRAAEMYGGEHVCRWVGPWVPAADAPEEA